MKNNDIADWMERAVIHFESLPYPSIEFLRLATFQFIFPLPTLLKLTFNIHYIILQIFQGKPFAFPLKCIDLWPPFGLPLNGLIYVWKLQLSFIKTIYFLMSWKSKFCTPEVKTHRKKNLLDNNITSRA